MLVDSTIPYAQNPPALFHALREAQASLAESEARYRRIVETTTQGVSVLDAAAGVITFVNARMAAMLGCQPEEMLGAPPHAFFFEDSRVLFEETMAELHRGHTRHVEGRLRRRDGSELWVQIEAVPMFEGGVMTGCFAMMVDITERHVAEQARAEAEKALRVTEEQLRQAQKMEAVGRLAGGIAHDFNNLLSVILSYSEMIVGDLRPADPIREDVQAILEAGRRAAGLTRQLLAFSRQQVLAPRVLHVGHVVADVERLLRRVVGADVEIRVQTADDLRRVRADAGSIEQVLMNLVVNARDAMPTGGTLTIETSNVTLSASKHGEASGPHVMLAVTDTGVGMDEVTRSRLFEPFFTTKEVGKGTGLGLATVYGIVHQSRGMIAVRSELGRGARFEVYLPCVEAPADSDAPEQAASATRGSETILLVDDDDAARDVAHAILERAGYRVIVTRNGREALDACDACDQRSGRIDLLLTDVVMPTMSGPELVRRLSSLRPDTRVLCMSGYTGDTLVDHCVAGTKLPFLQKPLTPQGLLRRVREVLDG